MRNQLIVLVTGFLLTTVIGGGLGFLFQRRAWEHQHRVLFEEQERQRASRVFEEVSRLLDKRLYRMKLVRRGWERQLEKSEESLPAAGLLDARLQLVHRGYRALVRHLQGGGEPSTVDDEWADYKGVVCEWNDGVNRNLALIQQYFGSGARDTFDNRVGKLTVEIGERLEAIHCGCAPLSHAALQGIEEQLEIAGRNIYAFNLEMIEALQGGKVGRLAPEHRERHR